MSLEVDGRSQLPEVQQPEKESYAYANLPAAGQAKTAEPFGASDKGDYEARPQGKKIFGLRATTLALGVALAVVTILAIVAAAVGGSLAAKRNHA